MEITILSRNNSAQWGGDFGVINSLKAGLEILGAKVEIVSHIDKLDKNKKYFLTNTCLDLRSIGASFNSSNIDYYILTFHEDFLSYYRTCYGFYALVHAIIEQKKYLDLDVVLDDLECNPELIAYFPIKLPMNGYLNSRVIENAKGVYPSSIKEQRTIERDAPKSKSKVVYLPTTDVKAKFLSGNKDQFLKTYKIDPGYILQVGRFEARKNQIATVLASRSIPVPLVFIATNGYDENYQRLLVKTILKYRKYPTLIVSQNMKSEDLGLLRIRQMPDGKKLSWEMLGSAYRNAAVNCHPAFYELPGLTYIESLALGVPTIFSNTTTIDEYIQGGVSTNFVDPFNIKKINEKIKKILAFSVVAEENLKIITNDSFCKSIYMDIV